LLGTVAHIVEIKLVELQGCASSNVKDHQVYAVARVIALVTRCEGKKGLGGVLSVIGKL
jgi:hypothetical protein